MTVENTRVHQQTLAKQRDNYTCQFCGDDDDKTPRNIQAHHIHAANDGGSDELDNLVTLCKDCHWRVHRHGPDEKGLYPISLAKTADYDSTTTPSTDIDAELVDWVQTDSRGRANLGSKYKGKKIKLAIYESKE